MKHFLRIFSLSALLLAGILGVISSAAAGRPAGFGKSAVPTASNPILATPPDASPKVKVTRVILKGSDTGMAFLESGHSMKELGLEDSSNLFSSALVMTEAGRQIFPICYQTENFDTDRTGLFWLTGMITPSESFQISPDMARVRLPIFLYDPANPAELPVTGIYGNTNEIRPVLYPLGTPLETIQKYLEGRTVTCTLPEGYTYEGSTVWDLSEVDPSVPGEYPVQGKIISGTEGILIPEHLDSCSAYISIQDPERLTLSSPYLFSGGLYSRFLKELPKNLPVRRWYRTGDGEWTEDQTTNLCFSYTNTLLINFNMLTPETDYQFRISCGEEYSNILEVRRSQNDFSFQLIEGDRDGGDREPVQVPDIIQPPPEDDGQLPDDSQKPNDSQTPEDNGQTPNDSQPPEDDGQSPDIPDGEDEENDDSEESNMEHSEMDDSGTQEETGIAESKKEESKEVEFKSSETELLESKQAESETQNTGADKSKTPESPSSESRTQNTGTQSTGTAKSVVRKDKTAPQITDPKEEDAKDYTVWSGMRIHSLLEADPGIKTIVFSKHQIRLEVPADSSLFSGMEEASLLRVELYPVGDNRIHVLLEIDGVPVSGLPPLLVTMGWPEPKDGTKSDESDPPLIYDGDGNYIGTSRILKDQPAISFTIPGNGEYEIRMKNGDIPSAGDGIQTGNYIKGDLSPSLPDLPFSVFLLFLLLPAVILYKKRRAK